MIEKLLTVLGLSGLGIGALLATAWFFGLMPILGAIARVLASIAEALVPLLQAAVQGLIWVWKNVFLPGLLDILDSWATVLTVCTLVGMMFLYTSANDAIKLNHSSHELNQCRAALTRFKKPIPRPEPRPPLWEFRFPWE